MADPRLAPYRVPALVFSGYLLVQAASAAVLFVLKLGGDVPGVRAFYLGSEERFTAAKSLAGLLEVAVPHLTAIPLVLFAVVHVVGFARALSRRSFGVITAVSFGSALAGVLAGFAVRFVSPGLAFLKIAAFVGLEGALLAWAALLVALSVQRAPASDAAPPAAQEVAR